jgi:toxin ParE1/3/4
MATILLPELRNIGRAGRAPGTRELVEPPYIIVYELSPKVVTVLAVVHGARVQ